MKVAELTGALLDLWVAKADPRCSELTLERCNDHYVGTAHIDGEKVVCIFIHDGNVLRKLRMRKLYDAECYGPSRNWAQGGPIVDRERISTHGYADGWAARSLPGPNAKRETGPTLLVAAMRCYVASKFGDTVPDEVAA